MIPIPIRAPKSPGGFEMRHFPMIEPHMLFHQLFTSIGVDVPREIVRQYWKVHRIDLKEDWATSSDASDEHIPFAFYGDSAKIKDDGTKIIGLYLSMPQVWGPKSRFARWCVFAIEEQKCFGHHTHSTRCLGTWSLVATCFLQDWIQSGLD